MKIIIKSALLISAAILMFMADVSLQQASKLPLGMQLMSDAEAVAGRQRRTRRRGAAVGYTAGASSASAASASTSQQQAATADQQAATADQQAATADQQAATAQQQSAAGAQSANGALPLGTVVSALPEGCAPMTAGDVEYQHCGADYYRAVFQGNSLVYVTADPSQP
jgi:hypothetical protein